MRWRSRLEEWTRRVDRTVHPIWLFDGDSDNIEAFVERYSLSGVEAISVHERSDVRFRELGVWGTPTSYLLDGSMRLRYGMIGDRFPPDSVTKAACPHR